MPPPANDARTSLAERYRVLLDVGRTLTGTLSLEELYRAIYHETSGLLESDGFYISLYDAESDRATVVFFVDQGEEQRTEITYRGSDSPVIRDAQGALVDDHLRDRSLLVLGDETPGVTRSAISAPMRRGRVIGAISAQSYRPSAYTEAELELLQGIADMAAVAVENAHYVEELHRTTHEAEQIERIGRALVSSLDPQEVLGKVVDAARDLLDADGASVWLVEPEGRVRVAASAGDRVPPPDVTWALQGTPLESLVRGGAPLRTGDAGGPSLVPDDLMIGRRPGWGLAVPLHGAHGVVGALFIARDQAPSPPADDLRILERVASQASVAIENARLHDSVQALSLTDPLTGLPNRRHLRMHLDREVAAARRGRALGLVIFDLDNFKQYNDSLGHVAGDQALQAFARILANENRAMNLVARYGGDEFVSVLSDTTEAGSALYVERVCERVAADETLSPFEITVSHGLAMFDAGSMRDGKELIEAADADLYGRKAERGATTG